MIRGCQVIIQDDSQYSIYDEIEDKEMIAEVAMALDSLPLQCKNAIIAFLWDGLTLSEYARRIGISRQCASEKYKKGIRRLRHPVRARKLFRFVNFETQCSPEYLEKLITFSLIDKPTNGCDLS